MQNDFLFSVKLCSDRVKANAKEKIFFDVCRLLPPAEEVWGKVMFLLVSVILFTGEGGLPTETGMGWTGPLKPEKWAVHILLECFLAFKSFFACSLIFSLLLPPSLGLD